MTDTKELTGCACRWDAEDNRVATCVRHQGWLDVVYEWADRAKSAEASVEALRTELAQQGQEPVAWRSEAVKWIRRKAEDQRETNEQHPRHAEAYPSWVGRVRQLHWLADDLECEQELPPFGLDPYQEPAPQAQPVAQPKTCATCTHFKQGKNPLIGIYDSDCYECSEYYGNRWEAAQGIEKAIRK